MVFKEILLKYNGNGKGKLGLCKIFTFNLKPLKGRISQGCCSCFIYYSNFSTTSFPQHLRALYRYLDSQLPCVLVKYFTDGGNWRTALVKELCTHTVSQSQNEGSFPTSNLSLNAFLGLTCAETSKEHCHLMMSKACGEQIAGPLTRLLLLQFVHTAALGKTCLYCCYSLHPNTAVGPSTCSVVSPGTKELRPDGPSKRYCNITTTNSTLALSTLVLPHWA